MYKLVGLVLVALLPCAAQRLPRNASEHVNNLAPYVISPQPVIDKMLALAELHSGDVVYDLGSGNGQVLITAAQRYHVKGVGVEINDKLVQETNDKLKKLSLDNRISIVHNDLMKVDLSPADVVIVYLDTMSNELLRPNLEKYLRPGARVISHDYAIRGWKPVRVEQIEAFNRTHNIYFYELPSKR